MRYTTAQAPLEIVESVPDFLYFVVFEGHGEPHYSNATYLRFKDLNSRVLLTNIYVDTPLRRQGVAERMVRLVAETYPHLPMTFEAMNPHSRRLARRLALSIPNLDPDEAAQKRHYERDLAAGFYGEVCPPVVPFLPPILDETEPFTEGKAKKDD